MRIALLCLAMFLPLCAKDKKPKTPPKPPLDAIEVVAHIPTTTGPVRRFLPTEHYSSHYLYAEHDAGTSVTLIDITRPNLPSILAEVPYPSGGSDSLVVVSGTSALVACLSEFVSISPP